MKTCPQCGESFEQRGGPGRPRIYCSRTCGQRAYQARRPPDPRDRRQPYGSKRGTCAECGEVIWRGPTSLPEGRAKCLPCRRATRRSYRDRFTPCVDCGTPSAPKSPRCMSCAVKARYPGKGRDLQKRREHDKRRKARMRAAPGLTVYKYYALLAKWKAQGRTCTYCPAAADSVDHVIPLALGGTNYEGNLTPACLSCNFRKSDSLLIEYRRKLVSA